MMWAMAAALLAAGGAASAAEKEARIDWPARAATVKVGMTRAEVEKILPRLNPLPKPERKPGEPRELMPRGYHAKCSKIPSECVIVSIYGDETYLVAKDWEVTVSYSSPEGWVRSSVLSSWGSLDGFQVTAPVKIKKLK
jgi:hypothetical protein